MDVVYTHQECTFTSAAVMTSIAVNEPISATGIDRFTNEGPYKLPTGPPEDVFVATKGKEDGNTVNTLMRKDSRSDDSDENLHAETIPPNSSIIFIMRGHDETGKAMMQVKYKECKGWIYRKFIFGF